MGGRLGVLVIVLSVGAAACGGSTELVASTDAGESGAVPESVDGLDPDVLAFAEAVVADLGPDVGLLAVGYALDRGYAADQIVAAGLSGGLNADGTITGEDPVMDPWGIFSDLPEATGSAAGVPGVWAAPVVLWFADEPEGQVTSDGWMRGIGSGFEEIIDPALEDRHKQGLLRIAVIIELADAGYTPEQILLGIIQRSFVPALVRTGDGTQRCWLLKEEGVGIVLPEGEEVGAFSSTADCRDAIEGTIEDNHLATQPEAEAEAEDVSAGGGDEPTAPGEPPPDWATYTGTVRVSGEASRWITIHSSSAEITIEEGIAEVLIDLTTEWIWMEGDDANEPCITTERWVLRGRGSTEADGITVNVGFDSYELISISGNCEQEPAEEGETVPFTATISGDTLTRSFLEGIFTVTAARR